MSYKLQLISSILALTCHLSYSQFSDIGLTAGIEHVHIAPDLMGGGIGVIDFNNDGLEDLYFTGGVKEDKLFKNLGDGSFADITNSSGIYTATRTIKTTGVSIGDIDNDGFADIFITTADGYPLLLLLNQGDESFLNISAQSGLDQFDTFSMGSVMADFNQDGYLDIYAINYIKEYGSVLDSLGNVIGFSHNCYENNLFINQGDNTFLDKATEYNVADEGCSLAVSATDINYDNQIDLFVANDFGAWVQPNKVFINNKIEFIERSQEIGLNDSIYAMGIAQGDIDNNGINDYYVTNIGRNVLRKEINQTFIDITDESGTNFSKVDGLNSTGWGTMFIDVNNDTYVDLFVSNGYTPSAKFIETSEIDPNKLFINNHDNTFSDVSEDYNLDYSGKSRGCTWADLNNDGYPDIIVNNVERVRYKPESNVNVYLNDTSENNWIGFVLRGTIMNEDAIGAKVYVYANNQVLYKELNVSGSHASSHSKKMLFGLGTSTEIDSIKVQWGEIEQTFNSSIDINQYNLIIEGDPVTYSLGCNTSGQEFDIQWGCPETVTGTESGELFVSNIEYYPNPTSHSIKTTLKEDSLVEIIDLYGARVYKTYLESGNHEIDISSIKAGVYLIIFKSKGNQYFGKLHKI